MAILEQTQFVGSGMVKEIEESAISLVLQNLQQDQYQYPIKSFIREITSNCVDAIEEKITAISILTGQTSVENHYGTDESAIFKDSKFDPTYYDLKFLSPENEIKITYFNRVSSNRDKVIIEDTGVGLGGNRLKGFFKPAFSTKRLNKKALGKFGIGSKSGLSTGVESYQIISRHNGREYHFDIYNDRYYSMVPRFNEFGENSKEVWRAKRFNEDNSIEEFNNDIYYYNTDQPNGVKILIDVKNPLRNKSKYIDAVKSQLTYFDNVKLYDEYEDKAESWRNKEIHFQTEIIYKDQHIIVPKNSYYAVPHLVLNGVNYGTIDFAEMEMDEKKGNIGIIGDPNEIDVNQSRESVRYTEKTREAIKKYLNNSISLAQKQVNKFIDDYKSDFVLWLIACRDINSKHKSDNLLSRLSGLADMSSIVFQYGDTNITYTHTNLKKLFENIRVTKVILDKYNDAYKTQTFEVHSWEQFTPDATHKILLKNRADDRIPVLTLAYIHETYNSYYPVYVFHYYDEVDSELISYIRKSNSIIDYDTLEVPQSFLDKYSSNQTKLEKEEEEKIVAEEISKKELRKYNGEILYHEFRANSNGYIANTENNLVKQKQSIKIDNVKNVFNKHTTIYGTSQDIPLLMSILYMIGNPNYDTKIIGKKNFNIIVVSNDTVKYISNYATHVIPALQNFNGNKLSLIIPIKNYNTARIIKHIYESDDYDYLRYFDNVDSDAADTYKQLCKYIIDNGQRSNTKFNVSGSTNIEEYLNLVTEFQLYLQQETDKNNIAEKAKEYFNNTKINSCDAIDLEIYAKFKALEDFVENIKDLLFPYSRYSSSYQRIREINAAAVREYITLKNIPPFETFLKERNEEFKVTQSNN